MYFADECVAGLVVDGLIARGFDVADARTICQGEADDRALSIAHAAGRVVITEDRGFGELVVRSAQPAVGIIVLTLHALPAGSRESYAIDRIIELGDRAIGRLALIEPGRIRLRLL
jgi:predicted nuclease of predicted toxin-antitoxin system